MAIASEFASQRPAPAWRVKLAGFWRWWIDELSQLVPERFAVLRHASRVPFLAIDRDEVTLVEPRPAPGLVGQVNLAPLDEERRRLAVRALLERVGEARGRARICLGHDEALVRRAAMPAATEENLRQVLGFEMDRLTPFRADDVYFDYRVVSRDAAAGQLTVQLAVARRELVDARVEKLRAWGANVQGVSVRDDVAHSAPLDLLPSEQHGERQSARERMVQRTLVVAIGALAVVALLLPAWQKRDTIIALHPVLAQVKQAAESTDAIARELEKQVADYNFLLARKHGTYPVLALVEEVSRLLPDNTWVQQLDVKTTGKTREVQVAGETSSSSRLIEILEQSTLLQNATPKGPVTRGSLPNTERFAIGAEVRPRPQPDATPVLEMPSAAFVPAAPPTASAGAPVAPPASDATTKPSARPVPAPDK